MSTPVGDINRLIDRAAAERAAAPLLECACGSRFFIDLTTVRTDPADSTLPEGLPPTKQCPGCGAIWQAKDGVGWQRAVYGRNLAALRAISTAL